VSSTQSIICATAMILDRVAGRDAVIGHEAHDSITLDADRHRLKCVRQVERLGKPMEEGAGCRAFRLFRLPAQQHPPAPEDEAGNPEH
jgi:hypothetical protein